MDNEAVKKYLQEQGFTETEGKFEDVKRFADGIGARVMAWPSFSYCVMYVDEMSPERRALFNEYVAKKSKADEMRRGLSGLFSKTASERSKAEETLARHGTFVKHLKEV